MATTTSKQGITFHNYDITSRIKVSFPLLYLHGCVTFDENIAFINCINGGDEIQWPVVGGEFKVFVHLKEGVNSLSLVCSENEVEVEAQYTKTPNDYYVLPIYIICKGSDGSFMAPDGVSNTVEDAIVKIRLNARLMQTYFAESLHEHGFERKTFYYAEDAETRPLVKILNCDIGLEEAMKLSRYDLYSTFRKEIAKSLGEDEKRKLLVFMSCTQYAPPPDVTEFTIDLIQSYVTGHAALGGGDMALFGNGSLHTWASSLHELNNKFSDITLIDRRKLFDDSCGRGSHMANYATTLGATVHELGHSFDLAHTQQGIMCRGHDDMNYFYTVVKPGSTNDISREKGVGNEKYKGAFWYRSSAVILYFHKWFNPSKSDDSNDVGVIRVCHPNVFGPVGNAGVCAQKDQTTFNSHLWCEEQGVKLTGIVLYHEEYLYGIQFLGEKHEAGSNNSLSSSDDCTEKAEDEDEDVSQEEGREIMSEIFGSQTETTLKTTFTLESDEKLTNIRVRSGAWIDGLDIETDKRCTEWLGGAGGDVVEFNFSPDQVLKAVVGTAGEIVGSIAFILKNTNEDINKTCGIEATSVPLPVSFVSSIGIRLVETYDQDNGEVSYFREYLDTYAPCSISLCRDDLFAKNRGKVDGMVFDNGGGKCRFSLVEQELRLIDSVLSS